MNIPSSVVFSFTFLNKNPQIESQNLPLYQKLTFLIANKKSKQSDDISGTQTKHFIYLSPKSACVNRFWLWVVKKILKLAY